jgi:GH18 family chitinase
MAVRSIAQRRILVATALVIVIVPWFRVAADVQAPGGDRRRADFLVVGYLPDYRLDSFDPERARLLTDLIYFSIQPDATGGINSDRIRPDILAALRRAKEAHDTRLTLCVGGWERSRAFPALAASRNAREQFAKNLVAFCAKNHFDGVDVDWEHPRNEAEQQNYATLLVELKAAFQPRHLSLSIAMAGWQDIPAKGLAAVDRIHLMAYDADGRHSTPEFAEAEVARLVKKGAPREKICLGLPFYGRSIQGRSKTMTYADLVDKYRPAADVDEVDGLYFNGATTIERKTRYALDHKLAGVMVWEIGQDAKGEHSLLRAIRRVAPSDPSARAQP